MRISPQARPKCQRLPEFWQARAVTIIDQRARKHARLTSLLDRKRYKPADIAACYERRWHVETSYREPKQTKSGTALTLRSRIIEGAYQEIWGALTAKAPLEVKCESTRYLLAIPYADSWRRWCRGIARRIRHGGSFRPTLICTGPASWHLCLPGCRIVHFGTDFSMVVTRPMNAMKTLAAHPHPIVIYIR